MMMMMMMTNNPKPQTLDPRPQTLHPNQSDVPCREKGLFKADPEMLLPIGIADGLLLPLFRLETPLPARER